VSEIINWEPTPEMRYHSPDRRYVGTKLQRKFIIICSDGTTGELWDEVHAGNTYVRVTQDGPAG
jgi:hypothetical protein